LVRRSPLKDKTPIAITALDEAGVRFDPEVDSRMTERGRNLARAVAGDLNGFDPDDFRRRDLHPPELATAHPRFNVAPNCIGRVP
jgi:hypothetical protein